MPSGAVENHDDMDVLRNGVGELGEVEVHHRLVGIGQDQGEGLTGGGFDGAEDVGAFEALVAEPGRSLAAPPPAVAKAADAVVLLVDHLDRLLPGWKWPNDRAGSRSKVYSPGSAFGNWAQAVLQTIRTRYRLRAPRGTAFGGSD